MTSVLMSLSGAAGRALISPGNVTNVASITNFASALCGLQMTEEMMVAVGTAESDVRSGAPARYGMGGFARVAIRLGDAMQEISSRLAGGWDSLVVLAALRELQSLPAAAKSTAAHAAGSVLRRHLLAANWTPLPTPSRVIATTACAHVPVSSVGGGWEEGMLPGLAPAASMPGGLFDVSDLSPEAARTLTTLLARQRANKRSLAEALTDSPPSGREALAAHAVGGMGGMLGPVALHGVTPFFFAFSPLGQRSDADAVCRELGAAGTRDALAALLNRTRRASLVVGSSAGLLKEMSDDFDQFMGKYPGLLGASVGASCDVGRGSGPPERLGPSHIHTAVGFAGGR